MKAVAFVARTLCWYHCSVIIAGIIVRIIVQAGDHDICHEYQGWSRGYHKYKSTSTSRAQSTVVDARDPDYLMRATSSTSRTR